MTLTLYSYWRSSSAWRVRIGLALKGLEYQYRAVDLLRREQFEAPHQARNPMSQVPVLEVAESGHAVRLAQSMAILEWLDERYPQPRLLPEDVDGRARVRMIAEYVNSGIQPLQNAIVLRTIKEKVPGWEKEWARLWIGRGLDALDRVVGDGAGRFCHGDRPGLADCYVVPQLYSARRFGVDVERWPALRRVEASCEALPAFQAAHADRQPDAPPPEGRTP
jgi:maleylpyruvate isomerase